MKHILNYVSCIINNNPLQSCKVTNETIIFRVNLFKGKGIKILPSKLVQNRENAIQVFSFIFQLVVESIRNFHKHLI